MRYTLFLILIPIALLNAQHVVQKKLKELKLQPKVTNISVDRLGGFYVVGECGVEQFDPEGKLTKKYKLDDCNTTDLLEAWSLMRIYAYQNYKQQFTVFNNHLEEVVKLDIDPSFAVEPQLATPSYDLRHYWILDIDNSINRVSLNSNSVDIETETLKSIDGKFLHMREYQNLLFLLHEKSGIFVIDKLGKLVFRIPDLKTNYFSFAGEDLYYLQNNKVHFFDIFTRDTYSVDVPSDFKFVIATDERLVLIKDGVAEIHEFRPKK
jgi:hypothetical protein